MTARMSGIRPILCRAVKTHTECLPKRSITDTSYTRPGGHTCLKNARCIQKKESIMSLWR